MQYATLTSQNQITVPSKVRDSLAIKPGDKLAFYDTSGQITVSKLKSIREYEGILKKTSVKYSNNAEEGAWLERHLKNAKRSSK